MIKAIVEGCEPTRGSKYSACIDLYASENVVIMAGDTKLVGLGVAIDKFKLADAVWYLGDCDRETLDNEVSKFKSSHYLQLMLRSSMSKHLVIANGVGVIDLDYEDEIKIRLHLPHSLKPDGFYQYGINKGDKIAQIILLEHKSDLFGVSTDAKRTGGFGSTNKGDKNEVS